MNNGPVGAATWLTPCQAGRMHRWLNTSGSNLLSSGHEAPDLAGVISSSNYYGPLVCCSQNIMSAQAQVNIQAPGASSIVWSKTGGSGSFSSNSNGTVLNVSNLGSINMRVNWTKNCINYNRTYTLYNGNSFMMSGPNPVGDFLTVEVINDQEWLELARKDELDTDVLDSWELDTDQGRLVRQGRNLHQLKRFDVPFQGLRSGIYNLILRKGDIQIERKIVKV